VSRRLPSLAFDSLQGKFLWGTVLVVVLVMAAVVMVVEHRQRVAIIEEVQRRGEILARNLAAISSGPLLLYDYTALEQHAAWIGSEADVVYAIVLDADGRVAAHSGRPERIGTELTGEADRRAARTDVPLVQEAILHRESVYDVAVPIVVNQQKWGTARVSVSKSRMEAEIVRTRWELGAITLVTLLLSGCAAALVARRIAGPIRELAAGASAISRGELDPRIEPRTSDELGRLAVAFNDMADQLFQQRSALQDAHAELSRRFEELQDLKSYTENVFRSLTTGIVTVDLEGRIVTLNPAGELLTGYFAGEAHDRYCTEVFAHTAEVGEILMETLATRTGVAPVPLMLRRRNGTSVAVELSTAPLRAGEGKELGVVGMLRDVSLVRELEGRLRRSDHLAALGTLAAGLAHEIKNPLTSLLTFTRHLDRRFDDEGFREKFSRVVPRELERINAIVDRLLELSRPPRLAFELVRVSAVLDRALELYANEIESRHVRLRRHYTRDVPGIQADADALYRALVNLVANALDAMPKGGHLTVMVGWDDRARPRLPGRAGSDAMVRIDIQDDGVGIPASNADSVFNPFFTTKDGGTGLGLALTHKIVDDHGGAIDFTSAPGRGTTFRIVLPIRPVSRGAEDDTRRD